MLLVVLSARVGGCLGFIIVQSACWSDPYLPMFQSVSVSVSGVVDSVHSNGGLSSRVVDCL